jgi:hypothetical protein
MFQRCSSPVEPSDIVLEVMQDETAGQTTEAPSNEGIECANSISVDVSWIKLRDQRWFCGWLWAATLSSLETQSSPTVAVLNESKSVTVNELACNFL